MKRFLKAWLFSNPLTPDPNDYLASVVSNGSVGVPQIVDGIMEDGSEIKKETIQNIITRFNKKAAEMALSGYNVNTGLVYMRPVIRGIFYNKTWNSDVNSVYVSITQGADLRLAVADTVVDILGEKSDMMEILSVTDLSNGNTDGTLRKGRNIEIRGSLLKIDGTEASCGIHFTDTTTQDVITMAPEDLVLNERSRLLILLPADMTAGEYELSITTQYSGGGVLLKQARSASFKHPVVIE